MLQAPACGTVYHRTCDETWTLRVSSVNWKHFYSGVSQPRRIVTVCLFCALEILLLTYLIVYVVLLLEAVSTVRSSRVSSFMVAIGERCTAVADACSWAVMLWITVLSSSCIDRSTIQHGIMLAVYCSVRIVDLMNRPDTQYVSVRSTRHQNNALHLLRLKKWWT